MPVGAHRCSECGGLCAGQATLTRRWIAPLPDGAAHYCGVPRCLGAARWEIVSEWGGRPVTATHGRRCDRHGRAFAARWALRLPGAAPAELEAPAPQGGAEVADGA